MESRIQINAAIIYGYLISFCDPQNMFVQVDLGAGYLQTDIPDCHIHATIFKTG